MSGAACCVRGQNLRLDQITCRCSWQHQVAVSKTVFDENSGIHRAGRQDPGERSQGFLHHCQKRSTRKFRCSSSGPTEGGYVW
jgi:hypothetical protein